MSDRAPVMEPPIEGETSTERTRRIRRNKAARDEWRRYLAEPCRRCGLVRGNVVHEQDPDHSPEGAAYHAEFEHHIFEGRS